MDLTIGGFTVIIPKLKIKNKRKKIFSLIIILLPLNFMEHLSVMSNKF